MRFVKNMRIDIIRHSDKFINFYKIAIHKNYIKKTQLKLKTAIHKSPIIPDCKRLIISPKKKKKIVTVPIFINSPINLNFARND